MQHLDKKKKKYETKRRNRKRQERGEIHAGT
jgi:hypothetical protein